MHFLSQHNEDSIVELTYLRAVLHNLYGTQLGETYKAVSGVTYLF